MKSYTDIEQSKKLAEFLPLESADMYYEEVCNLPKVIVVTKVIVGNYILHNQCMADKDYKRLSNPVLSPAWSFAALLDVLPQSITKYIDDEKCQKTFHLNLFRSYYHCCSYSFAPSISDDDGNNTLYCIGRDNWIDTCVEMILKLHELNLL